MIIKNYFIKDNKEKYIDLIIKELIRNNIAYLYIKESNELHFDNYILRFYDKNNIKKSNTNINDIFNYIYKIFEEKNIFNISEQKEYIDKSNTKNKKYYKKQYKTYNNKLTQAKKPILKKQLNPTRKIYK